MCLSTHSELVELNLFKNNPNINPSTWSQSKLFMMVFWQQLLYRTPMRYLLNLLFQLQIAPYPQWLQCLIVVWREFIQCLVPHHPVLLQQSRCLTVQWVSDMPFILISIDRGNRKNPLRPNLGRKLLAVRRWLHGLRQDWVEAIRTVRLDLNTFNYFFYLTRNLLNRNLLIFKWKVRDFYVLLLRFVLVLLIHVSLVPEQVH